MLVQLRRIHLYSGWLFIVVFVLTGQYMRHVIHPLMESDPVLRYSLRGNHIYILLLGLVHLCLDRPVTLIGIVMAVAGVGLHLL
jgi:hypothetical protein